MKATSFMKSRKFLGIPGFFSRMKERGALVKDVSLRFIIGVASRVVRCLLGRDLEVEEEGCSADLEC